MVWSYLLCIMGNSTKVVENVNQNCSGEWNSHVHGVLSFAAVGGRGGPQWSVGLSFSLCSSASSSTFTHHNCKPGSIGLRKNTHNNKS